MVTADRSKQIHSRERTRVPQLAGSFQGAAAGEAMEGIGEGAAKGGEGSAPAVVAGMGMAGAVFTAANATRTAPCPKCGVQVAAGAKFCPSCGAEQPLAAP
jgi:zinc-ribbon domain